MAQAIAGEPSSDEKQKRPLILTIVTLLLFVRVIFVAALTVFGFVGLMTTEIPMNILGAEQVLGVIFLFGITLLLLTAALGLWLLRPWAWQMNMIILGFYLIINLYTDNNKVGILGNDVTMLLNILIVFYLVQKDVRLLFVHKPAMGA